MRRDTQYFRQRKKALDLTDKQLAALIEQVTQKKFRGRRPEAAVSRQLSKSKMTPGMAKIYDEALMLAEKNSPQPPPAAGSGTFPTSHMEKAGYATHLIMGCTEDQLDRIIAYLEGLLQVPPQRR